ncbi:hypothetical protein COHA_010316 [Chlorella ohadii]|uniref:Large-conductance mechanosensitive channel n=1 Tax=Chlorella ohadii TaxID=2649997 RepID=A0AAD5DE05_9CHLO|nr:hypothetical protein COHA_010316 [Chlorella ohadii]
MGGAEDVKHVEDKGLAGRSKAMGKAAMGCAGKQCAGFRDFLLRGNVVDMAIGIVVGGAFTALVNALVTDLITPFISAIWGGTNFNELTFSINGSKFFYGHFINQLITFVIICAVLYFAVVMPMNHLIKSMFPEKPKKPERPDGCPFCGHSPLPYTAIKCSACCSELPPLPSETLVDLQQKEAEMNADKNADEEIKKPAEKVKV